MQSPIPHQQLPVDLCCCSTADEVLTVSCWPLFLQVSNAAGYLCHIQLQCTLDVSPEVVFEIFSHPDNAGAFRDIKEVGYRKVCWAYSAGHQHKQCL